MMKLEYGVQKISVNSNVVVSENRVSWHYKEEEQ